jgi:2-iminobutanoate/2-iminopropanoate deaminase
VERLRVGKETGAYSAAVAARGRYLFVSGHGPMRGGEFVRGSVEEETRVTLENLLSTIEAAGGRKEGIGKCSCFLADIGEFDRFNVAYRDFFGTDFPARTTVGVSLSDGIKVEIEAIVCLDI